MPSTVVHAGFALLLAAGLLGRYYDRRALAALFVVIVLPEVDSFLGPIMPGAHRTVGHNLVFPAVGALLPSVETATNLVLDAAPRLGERVVVFGAGVIGLCVTRLLASFPLSSLVVVDPVERRRDLAAAMGADRTETPETVGDAVRDADLALELSGRPSTLDDAIDAVGYDSRIVVGSWYGTKRAPIDLGGRFHRERIDLISSQVSTISPSLRGRWDRDRRFDEALGWLDRIDADALITHRIPFERAPEAYELLDSEASDAVQVILAYGES